MTNVNSLIHDWENNLAHAREVCKESGFESKECETAWESSKELDIHFEQVAEMLPSSSTQA